jgi:hypothetical protein
MRIAICLDDDTRLVFRRHKTGMSKACKGSIEDFTDNTPTIGSI